MYQNQYSLNTKKQGPITRTICMLQQNMTTSSRIKLVPSSLTHPPTCSDHEHGSGRTKETPQKFPFRIETSGHVPSNHARTYKFVDNPIYSDAHDNLRVLSYRGGVTHFETHNAHRNLPLLTAVRNSEAFFFL